MAKKVCIAGAGPSGLAAAKAFLHGAPPGSFSVTVFDPRPRVGGMWPADPAADNGVHPHMLANQSRHTVQFSDLAWSPRDPQFPPAWMIGRYLARYAKRYCEGARLRLGWRVETVEFTHGQTWRVTARREAPGEEEVHTEVYDHLVVATGFFGKPMVPGLLPKDPEIPVIYSSEYRDLRSLLPGDGPPGRPRRILVAGSQMSGVEIAATITTHISSALNSPDPSMKRGLEGCAVYHTVQRPIWVMPHFTKVRDRT
jgi:cation diffusion facilitator CzcD-associated flavoprotein CzcO